MRDAFILDAVRTPRAKKGGKFTKVHPVDLLTYPLKAIVERNQILAEQIEDVIVGCVTQAGEQGWCVGRAAVLAAGWPVTVPATTINRLCASGQQAVNFAAMGVGCEHYELVIGGGLEHMTRAPMFSDGGGEVSPLLQRHHPDLVQQGIAAEIMAEEFKLSRKALDEFAFRSQMYAKRAQEENRFKNSLIAVDYQDEAGETHVLSADDTVRGGTTVEGLAGLRTVFKENGVITAGNASAIVDGAAAVLVASERAVTELSLRPRAKVVSMAQVGSPPRIMLTGPIEASKEALRRAGMGVNDIDLWEINEAFAPVPLVVMQELGIDPERVNVNGGGISLGHPLGATGAMLIGAALDELERSNKKYALVTMCIGLGMGVATVIERI